MFLIIKVNVPIDFRRFYGKLKPLQSSRMKKFTEGAYQLMKNVDHYGCMTKKNCQLKSSTMARSFFNIRRGR